MPECAGILYPVPGTGLGSKRELGGKNQSKLI